MQISKNKLMHFKKKYPASFNIFNFTTKFVQWKHKKQTAH